MTRDDNHNSGFDAYLQPGRTVGHYTIVEKVGEGGMGEVYLADDSHLRRQVALKFLPAHSAEKPELRERFQREARAAASLNHPNILTIHEIGDFRGRPYIVMEYFNGRSIKSFVRENSPSEKQIIRILMQIADGLECAHEAGVIHRDIKSENLLIDHAGRVKIVDFGLARVQRDAELTADDATIGSVSYMAPEQVAGKRADARSDLFSLGVVLYELATGALPFTREHPGATMQAIVKEDPEPLTARRDDLSPVWDEITSGLLAKSPGVRYQSARVLRQDIERIAEQQDITTTAVRRRGSRRKVASVVLILMAVIVTVVMYWWYGSYQAAEEGNRKMLVVLPFDNLGDSTHAYFATGIADEISTHLTKLNQLGIISRSSAEQYAASDKTYDEISGELDVDYILEGNVRWDESEQSRRVRITTTLHNVEDKVAIWSETYDRVLEDIFAVQTDIARNVSSAMNVRLLESEKAEIARTPTTNVDAYTFYMRGQDYFNDGEWQLAEQMFNRALALDSTFARAWAMLSRTHSLLYWWYVDRTDERLEMARNAAETALHLNPVLADAHLALGRYLYRGRLDFDGALSQYEQALKLQPNNSDIMFAIGAARRRQGDWTAAIDNFRHAITLDPRSRQKIRNLAETYYYTRKIDSALVAVDRLIELAPDDIAAYALKARIYAVGRGDLKSANGVIAGLSVPPTHFELIDIVSTVRVLGHQCDRAVELLNAVRNHPYYRDDSAFYYLQRGEALRCAGSLDAARANYDSARVILETTVSARPDDATYHSMLGVAYAGLGMDEQAVREGRKAVELTGVEDDALTGAFWHQNLALVYALLGMEEAARRELEFLLSVPSGVTKHYVELHPILNLK